MMRIILSAVLFVFLSSPIAVAGPAEDMDNMLGQAYQLVIDGKAEQAKGQFASAADLSLQSKNDRGAIESIRGLYVLGEHDTALQYADKVVAQGFSWRSVCGAGYFYASLKGMEEKASQAFVHSYKLASNTGDWYGMAESAKGVFQIGKKQEALGMLEAAEKTAEIQKAYPRMKMIADMYRFMGEDARAIALEERVKDMTAPQPVVLDALPGEKKVSPEAQIARNQQVQQNMASDDAYIAQQEMQKQEEKYYQEWFKYGPYFSFMLYDVSNTYGCGSLGPDVVIAPGMRTQWANGCMRHYQRSGTGSYMYIDVD